MEKLIQLLWAFICNDSLAINLNVCVTLAVNERSHYGFYMEEQLVEIISFKN